MHTLRRLSAALLLAHVGECMFLRKKPEEEPQRKILFDACTACDGKFPNEEHHPTCDHSETANDDNCPWTGEFQTGDFKLQWNMFTPYSYDGFCDITVSHTHNGGDAWLAIGVSLDGQMIGGPPKNWRRFWRRPTYTQAIVADFSGDAPIALRHNLLGYTESEVQLAKDTQGKCVWTVRFLAPPPCDFGWGGEMASTFGSPPFEDVLRGAYAEGSRPARFDALF